jgi:hypothetical protein
MRRSGFKTFVAAALVGSLLLGGEAIVGIGTNTAAAAPESAFTKIQLVRSPVHRSTVRVLPNVVNFALPPTSAGCGGATQLSGGASSIPITVSVVKGQVEELTNVCLNGKGPFPFLIDTGAAFSVVATQLAKQLDLPDIGPAGGAYGIGCTLSTQPVSVRSWSVGGVNLTPQNLVATTQPYFGVKGQPDGLLGSDVLSRFGAVRLDFAAKALTLGGPEGPAPTGYVGVNGPTGPPPSSTVTHGQTGSTVPVTVMLGPGGTEMNVPLRFGKGPSLTFSVDTGTSQSLVSSSEAKVQHLVGTNLAQVSSSVCSTTTVPLVHSGKWSIPGATLHPQLIESIPFDPAATGGVYGTLGSDQLIHFGWVVFDYTGGRLILG